MAWRRQASEYHQLIACQPVWWRALRFLSLTRVYPGARSLSNGDQCMKKRIIRYSSLFILAILMASVMIAQTTSGSITGTITDPNQAAISGATVKVTEE